MGGQQFGEGTILIDTRSLDRVVELNEDAGLVTVEGGIQWPALLDGLARRQAGRAHAWSIHQKQTGADRLTLAGALACNAHGRGLTLPPIAAQVEAFDLVNWRGDVVTCSRTQNTELFRLAIGGYGLFGVVSRITLRLRPRVRVRRVVEISETATIMDRFEERIGDGFLYGDYQFTIDDSRPDFLDHGVFSCYEPVPDDTPLTASPIRFTREDWSHLVKLAHWQKHAAFQVYSTRYLETSGQIYWSDAQLAEYLDDYHADLDRERGGAVNGSEMITELYVPRAQFSAFMTDACAALRQRRANVIYGTVRLIERDEETFLRWARDRYACIVFNLHVDHTAAAIAAAAETFRALIDLAIVRDGSYYLTYHRWARKDQVEQCYPQMRAFLHQKLRFDPFELFQSDWYRHHRAMFV